MLPWKELAGSYGACLTLGNRDVGASFLDLPQSWLPYPGRAPLCCLFQSIVPSYVTSAGDLAH